MPPKLRKEKTMNSQPVVTTDFCDQIGEEVRVFFNSEQFKDLFKVSLVDAITKEMQNLREQLEQTESRVLVLETDLKEKATTIASLQKQQKHNNEEIASLKRSSNDAEQYSRRNCLRLYGIPENDHEDTDAVMLNLASKELNVKLRTEDIDRSHRIGAPRTAMTGEKPKPPRPIIVKFTTYRTRHLVIKNRKLLKGKRIGIEEDLTSKNRELLQKTKEEVKKTERYSLLGLLMGESRHL